MAGIPCPTTNKTNNAAAATLAAVAFEFSKSRRALTAATRTADMIVTDASNGRDCGTYNAQAGKLSRDSSASPVLGRDARPYLQESQASNISIYYCRSGQHRG